MPEIEDRLAEIRARIGRALERAGDPDRPITVIAVTKNVPAATIEAVAAAGIRDVGESRVQAGLLKAKEVRARVRWHLIGHLQRNKVKTAVELFEVIHSVDSLRLVDGLAATGAAAEVFLQVNVSGEATKGGVPPGEARALWQRALGGSLRVTGLMTMAPWSSDPEGARAVFCGLRELREDLDRAGDGPPLRHLSMGMSSDYEVAVEEGATHVRIGTALVGGIAPDGR